ncbi:MAG: reverse transcriptase domain-containing protein [Bryobacterales bacterium]|nr:reverse transcriptase domain-containing protein [Bryobacterales bacterium]
MHAVSRRAWGLRLRGIAARLAKAPGAVWPSPSVPRGRHPRLDFRSSHLSHEWLLQFIQHRVADKRMLRLIQKWLKAGLNEDGQWAETKEGTPQGAVVSPLLAHVYLHYVFDLWVEQWQKRQARGDVIDFRAVCR